MKNNHLRFCLLGIVTLMAISGCRYEKEIGNCGTSKTLKDMGNGICCDDKNNCYTYDGKVVSTAEDEEKHKHDAETEVEPPPQFKVCDCKVTDLDSDGDCMNDDVERNFIKLDGTIGLDPNNPDTDGDGILDGCEDSNHNGRVDYLDLNGNGVFDSGDVLLESDPSLDDSDGDGIPDGVEDKNHNGIYDAANGETKSTDRDSDRDGIPDGLEDKNHNGIVDEGETDPRKADTDDDGIPDGIEDVNRNGECDTYILCDGYDQVFEDPVKGDKNGHPLIPKYVGFAAVGDGDGASDAGSDSTEGLPAGANCVRYRETCAYIGDMDNDGLLDGIELKYDAANNPDVRFDDPRGKPGVPVDLRETDPFNPDTDGDCALCPDVELENCPYRDGYEDKNHNGRVDKGESDPLSQDSDGDGIPDTIEDRNCNGIVDKDESSPVLFDSDGDGLPDYLEDTNHNGICDQIDGLYIETCAYLADTDGDGLLDGEEDFNLDGRRGVGETDPRIADTDGDGLLDGEEILNYQTSPINPDSDGDGLLDGEEDVNHNCQVDSGETDPRVKNDAPVDPTPVASSESCSTNEECNMNGQSGRICSESPACPAGVEKCCVTAEWARWQICSTNNLKPLTYAQYIGHTMANGLPLGDDYSLAFEVEVPVGKDNQLPENRSEYIINAFGDDKTGDGIFDPNNMNDRLLGHAFQSDANKLFASNGQRLDRDIYGFIYILDDTTVKGELSEIQNFFRNLIVNNSASSSIRYNVDYQVLGSIDKTHDSSSQFPISKVSDRYEVTIYDAGDSTKKSQVSPFFVRNDIMKRILGGSLPAGAPKNDIVDHGDRNFAFDAFQIRAEIVKRPNNIYLIIVSLTQNDSAGASEEVEARYLDRVVRLEDLSEGSALSRHDATVSKQCIMNNPAQARADLVFMIDDSGSMQQVINSARQAAADVRSVLSASRDFFDFRLAMTTSNRSATINNGQSYSGGGGNFYWEYSANKVELPENAGFFGFGTEKACNTEMVDISHDAAFDNGKGNKPCGSDIDRVQCARLINACDNGLDIFSSQVCDMIYAMGGMCGVEGRPYSGVEEGSRSVLKFINRTIPAKPAIVNGNSKSWDKMHLRSWCDDPASPSCPATCDPRPLARRTMSESSKQGCNIDEDCMPGESCLFSYGNADGASDTDPLRCNSVNGKCCYKLEYCENDNQCGAGNVCRSGNGCAAVKVSENCENNAQCGAGQTCQSGDDCASGNCCYKTECCFQDCEMVPLIGVFISDEEDGYFKDDCRIWSYNSDGFDYEQLPSHCVGNPDSPTGDCTYDYCIRQIYDLESSADPLSPANLIGGWPVAHDINEIDSSFWESEAKASNKELYNTWLPIYKQMCGLPGEYTEGTNGGKCRALHYRKYDELSDDTTYVNVNSKTGAVIAGSDCAACKRYLRRKELVDFYSIYGRMYAITRNEGKAGETRECGTGSAEQNRGDGKAFRDLASNTGGKFSDVCIAEKGGSYKSFLNTIIADAQAASVPYPLTGVPIAATIKVGIYGQTRGENGEWGMYYPERSRVNGFNYDPTFNSLTFHTTPVDSNGNGTIDPEEDEAARSSPNLPKAGELVVISYRYWINVPCNDSCSTSERCVQEQCTAGEYVATGRTCETAANCRTGEDCHDGFCAVLCESDRIDYCVCEPNCGNRCGTCENCEEDPLNPGCGICVPVNNLCACNPDPKVQTCDPVNNPYCGPGLRCDESCACVAVDIKSCKGIQFNQETGEVNTCGEDLYNCCEELAKDDDPSNDCCPPAQDIKCQTTSEGQRHFLQCKSTCDCGGACNPLLEFCSPVTCTCQTKGT